MTIVHRLFHAAMALSVAMSLGGCHPRQIDMDKASTGDERNNTAPNAPSGLERNPGQPVPERPPNP